MPQRREKEWLGDAGSWEHPDLPSVSPPGSGVLAVLLVAVFLEPIKDAQQKDDGEKKLPFWFTLLSTFRLLRDKRLRLLVLLPVYSGFEQAFLAGDYTRVRKSPSGRAPQHPRVSGSPARGLSGGRGLWSRRAGSGVRSSASSLFPVPPELGLDSGAWLSLEMCLLGKGPRAPGAVTWNVSCARPSCLLCAQGRPPRGQASRDTCPRGSPPVWCPVLKTVMGCRGRDASDGGSTEQRRLLPKVPAGGRGAEGPRAGSKAAPWGLPFLDQKTSLAPCPPQLTPT